MMAIDSNNPINTKSPDALVAVGLSAALNILVLPTGSASAASNTAIIQAAIDAGQETNVSAGPGGGDIYISDSLQYQEGTRLTTVRGSRLRSAPGTNKSLIIPKKLNQAWSAVTITWSAGATSKQASVSWPGHGRSIGDRIVINNAVDGSAVAIPSWWDIFRIIAITDADNFVIALPTIPTVAPTGTVNAKACDRNVEIDVDLHFDFVNNNTAAGLDRMAAICAFIADSTVRVRARDVHKYALLLAGFANVDGMAETYPSANSDTLKLYGPGETAQFQAIGSGPEDCFSFQAQEPSAFLVYMPCQGNLRSIDVTFPDAQATTAGSGAAVVYSDETYALNGLRIHGGELRTTASGLSPFQIRPGAGFSSSGSKIGDVVLEKVALRSQDADLIRVVSTLKTLTLRDVSLHPPATDTRYGIYIGTAAGSVQTLILDALRIDWSWPLSATGYFLRNENTARNIILRNCFIRGSASLLRLLFMASASSCESITFENCDVENVSTLVRIDAAATVAPNVNLFGG